jgi:hypothetical protein
VNHHHGVDFPTGGSFTTEARAGCNSPVFYLLAREADLLVRYQPLAGFFWGLQLAEKCVALSRQTNTASLKTEGRARMWRDRLPTQDVTTDVTQTAA